MGTRVRSDKKDTVPCQLDWTLPPQLGAGYRSLTAAAADNCEASRKLAKSWPPIDDLADEVGYT